MAWRHHLQATAVVSLLPDAHMIRMIVELVGNRTFTLTTGHRRRQTEQITPPQERRPTGIRPGIPS